MNSSGGVKLKVEDLNKANNLILEMQRIDETIDHLYGQKNKENIEEIKESWRFELNGFSTIFTNKTFNIIVDALRVAYKKAEEELENL